MIFLSFEILEADIYKDHLDLFDDNFHTDKAGAEVLGRMATPIISKSEKLANRVINILKSNTAEIENSKIADIMSETNYNTITYNISVLLAFLNGIEA